MLSALVGVNNCRRGSEKMFDAFQNIHINKHLCYTLVEMLLTTLVHELEGRELADVLVCRATGGQKGVESCSFLRVYSG
jgi:hypothetical protein